MYATDNRVSKKSRPIYEALIYIAKNIICNVKLTTCMERANS